MTQIDKKKRNCGIGCCSIILERQTVISVPVVWFSYCHTQTHTHCRSVSRGYFCLFSYSVFPKHIGYYSLVCFIRCRHTMVNVSLLWQKSYENRKKPYLRSLERFCGQMFNLFHFFNENVTRSVPSDCVLFISSVRCIWWLWLWCIASHTFACHCVFGCIDINTIDDWDQIVIDRIFIDENNAICQSNTTKRRDSSHWFDGKTFVCKSEREWDDWVCGTATREVKTLLLFTLYSFVLLNSHCLESLIVQQRNHQC